MILSMLDVWSNMQSTKEKSFFLVNKKEIYAKKIHNLQSNFSLLSRQAFKGLQENAIVVVRL
jgi:hypothetical protein